MHIAAIVVSVVGLLASCAVVSAQDRVSGPAPGQTPPVPKPLIVAPWFAPAPRHAPPVALFPPRATGTRDASSLKASGAPGESTLPREGQRTAVVCGMVLIPANPEFDPAIRHHIPEEERFALKTIAPQVCRP